MFYGIWHLGQSVHSVANVGTVGNVGVPDLLSPFCPLEPMYIRIIMLANMYSYF